MTTTTTTITSPPTAPSPKHKAISFASAINFHQSMTLPATSSHPQLRVSFATSSNFVASVTAPTVLFCGGMGASRFLIWRVDEVARREGVRVVFVDRPGIGGSTPVSLNQRVQVWLEVVPAVLDKLGVDSVALVSHSAGAIYAVNTLVHLPHLMHPSRPFVGMLTPWVHPIHSSAPLMQLVSHLPTSAIGSLHHVIKFVGGYIEPPIQFSSGMLGVNDDALSEDQCREYYGMDSKTWREVCKLQSCWMREEDMSGISADATLCMQKDARDWGAYTSLPTTISALTRLYPPHSSTISIRAYFAETDKMIGKQGQVYFESCWADASAEVDFATEVVEDTDHDGICLVEKKCLGRVFGQIKERVG